jgi:mannose-6-phosphate isomerase-like protein (cupin superfamily)
MMRVKVTKKPWGEEHLIASCDKYAGKILVIKKGHRLSLQYHKKKLETFYVLDGLLKITLGTARNKLRTRLVKPGKIVHVPALTIHRTEAVSDCRLIEVSTPELTDIVRLDDDYNRMKARVQQTR